MEDVPFREPRSSHFCRCLRSLQRYNHLINSPARFPAVQVIAICLWWYNIFLDAGNPAGRIPEDWSLWFMWAANGAWSGAWCLVSDVLSGWWQEPSIYNHFRFFLQIRLSFWWKLPIIQSASVVGKWLGSATGGSLWPRLSMLENLGLGIHGGQLLVCVLIHRLTVYGVVLWAPRLRASHSKPTQRYLPNQFNKYLPGTYVPYQVSLKSSLPKSSLAAWLLEKEKGSCSNENNEWQMNNDQSMRIMKVMKKMKMMKMLELITG